jgi:phytoene dehydrogenase-like protein
MYFMAKAVKHMLEIVPPDPAALHPSELRSLARLARYFLDLDEKHAYTLARLMTMSSADFIERWFESEPLKGTLSASGIIGTYLGPRSPGTAYVLLHHYMGEIDGCFAPGLCQRGTGGISEAIAARLSLRGADHLAPQSLTCSTTRIRRWALFWKVAKNLF